jgi:hypothetical protein
MRRRTILLPPAAALALLLACLPGAAAPDPAGDAPPPHAEIRREMRELFQNRLRARLGLTDEQMQAIGPRIEHLEEGRSTARRETLETMHELRMAYEGGAADGDLQLLLDRLEGIEREQRELERSELSEIDARLTTRQRVELRFFMEEFRSEMARKIQELRRDRGAPGRRSGARPGRP